jgi:predicted ribosomally synthesized peptide with SipW-like signal peptide
MSGRPKAIGYLLVLIVGLVAGSLAAPTFSAFTSADTTTGNRFQAHVDFRPPLVTASVIAKTAGGVPGYIKPSGTYYVYAQVDDSGNPPSGVSTVTANTSSFDTGITAAAMTEGSYPIGGVSYNYRSASLTANVGALPGSQLYSITASDVLAQSATQDGFTVTVDNVVPAGTDIQAENTSGGTLGRAEEGDTIAYTFTEQIEPDSIEAGWTGSSADVVVRFNDSGGNDLVQIWDAANATQLPLGEINTRGDFVGADLTFGASGTSSTMLQAGATITITLGTVSNASKIKTNANDTQLWTPSSSATDLAGNPCDISVVTELGVLDRDF